MTLFAACFWFAHDEPFGFKNGYGAIKRWFPAEWAKMDPTQRGDMASRFHSSLHAVVVLCHIYALSSCGIWFDSLAMCPACEPIFSITVGYFFFDFFIVTHYRMAFWQVFIVHHVAASTPYLSLIHI